MLMKGSSKSGLVTDKVVVFLGVFFAIAAVLYRGTGVGAAVPGMFMVYSTTTSAIATSNVSQWRIMNGTWGTASSTSKHGVDMREVVVKSARFKEEYIFAGLDSQGFITAQVYNGIKWTPTTTIERLNTAGDSIYRPFDLEYENDTDRAILVTRGGDNADPVYRIWNGSVWSATSTIDIPLTGAPRFIELASQRFSTSSKIAMIVIDANADIFGLEWNGSSWSLLGETRAWDVNGANAAKKVVDVAYESASGAAMFIWGNSVQTTAPYYRRWNGISFSASTTFSIAAMGGAAAWVQLEANKYSATNTLMFGVTDAGSDMNTALWTGTGWLAHTEHSAAVETILDKNFAVNFINATSSGKAWLTWNANTTVRELFNVVTWAANAGTADDTAYFVLDSSYQNAMMHELSYEENVGAAAKDIFIGVNLAPHLTTWSALSSVFAGPVVVVATAYFRIDMTPSRYWAYPTFTQSAYRWFENADSATAGAALTSAQDEAATTTSDGQQFRLRMLLHDATATSTAIEHAVALQFATRSGACDTAFSGETFATVTPSTAISFFDNPSVLDDAAVGGLGIDPGHSGHVVVNQTYEEQNAATTTSEIIQGRDGLWDFSLYDNNGATTVGSYCFRLVKRDGALLSTYSVVPQIGTYVKPTISTAYNQVFDYGGAASSTSLITVTDVGGGIITAGSDLRIPIATSSVNMLWDTSITAGSFGGTASAKVSNPVTYEGGGSVLVIPVDSDFSTGDTLTFSSFKFNSFGTATSSTPGAIGIFAGGSTDQTYDATTTQSVAIRGTVALAEHGEAGSQTTDQWDVLSSTTSVHYRYRLQVAGEHVSIATTTFSISGISGVDASNFSTMRLFEDGDNNGLANSTTTQTQTLRPTSDFSIGMSRQGCSIGNNFDCVDETVSDDDTTYVHVTGAGGSFDYYQMGNLSGSLPTITNVRVVLNARTTGSGAVVPAMNVSGDIYQGTQQSVTSSYALYGHDWPLNPSTRLPWTVTQVNNLIGGMIVSTAAGATRVTQLYIEVSYCVDCRLGGAWEGSVNISGTTGTIKFATSTAYIASSTGASAKHDYVLELGMTGLAEADTMTLGFSGQASSTGTTSQQTITMSSSVSSIAHTMDAGPAISNLTFNSGLAINLIESTFKWASTSMLLTDTEGCETISTVTAKAYVASTSNTGTLCSVSDVDCYSPPVSCSATTTGNACAGGADQTVDYDCGFKLWYIARPTNAGDWASSIWSVSVTTTDLTALQRTATNTNQTVEVNELSAFDVNPGYIDYGTLAPGAGTAASNSTTTLTNTGNKDVDPRLSGTDMTSVSDTILVGQQEYLADPFAVGGGMSLTTTATLLALLLPPSTSTTTPVVDYISWGIGVPAGKRPGTYSGTNTLEI